MPGIVKAKFTGTVHAALYRALSDARIKKDVVDVDDGEALEKLRMIRPKKYKYVDQVMHGRNEVIGFIAQEVREVIPESVALERDFVPNIYSIVTPDIPNRILTVGTSAKDGILRISTMRGAREINVYKSGLYDVKFNEGDITEDDLKDGMIFVYGFEVNDLHSLKKDNLWAINFASTQELDRQLQSAKIELDLVNTKLNMVIDILKNKGYM